MDQLVIDWLKRNPNGVLPVLKTFSDDIRKKFAKTIESYYAEPKPLDLSSMVKDMQKEVVTERWKLERIIRTSTSSVSNRGRLMAFFEDPDRYYYEYHWYSVPDNRQKPISRIRAKNN